jgi:zinc protease
MASKYQLKNGMNVLLIESRKSPVVSIQMWVKTGSADEKKGVEGISHFIEHLVFKGSDKFGAGEMAQAIEGSGGVLNAYTSFDQTVFHVTLSKDFVDSGLEVISEMMGRPKFDKTEIDNEREVVIEEIKRSLDNPHQQASRLLFSSMYHKHPYGIPVIGYDDNIRRVKREEIVDYYQKRYVPQNMNLVVVGDFESAEMKQKIKALYEGFSKNKLAKVKRISEPAKKTTEVTVKKSVFNESILYFSWPCPNAKHADATGLLTLAVILGQGESSRLVHKIRNEQKLVNSIGASVFSPKDPGFFAVSVALNKDNTREVLKSVEQTIEDLIRTGPTEDELRKAVRNIESEKLYSIETVDGLAELFGHCEFLYNDYKEFDKMLKKINALTCADIQKLARRYLDPKFLKVCFLAPVEPEDAKRQIQGWQKGMQEKFKVIARQPLMKKKRLKNLGVKWSPKAKSKAHAPKREVTPSGLRLVTKQIDGSPVTSIRLGFCGGMRFEDETKPGVNELVSRTWTAGTKKLSEHEMNLQIENLAAQLGAFGGRNSMGLSAISLAPDCEEMLTLISELVATPRFDLSAIEREKMLMTEYVRSRNDKPAQQCMLNLARLMFVDHPYSRDPYGTADSIKNLNAVDVQAHLKKALHAANGVLVVTGDFEKGVLKKRMNSIIKGLSSENPKMGEIKLTQLEAGQRKYVPLEKEQSHIALAYRGLKLGDKDRYAMELMQSVLSGQGGRLFIELRDKASLAYSVSPLRMDGIDGGYFGAYIGCSPEKGTKAVKMMKEEFVKLAEGLVPEEEMERARRYLLGRNDISRQRSSNMADALLFDELYNQPFDESEHFHENISAVTQKDVQALARRIFSTPYALSVVGRQDVSD